VRLLDKLDSLEIRERYAKACIQNGWSRPILELQIEIKLHQRQGQAVAQLEALLENNPQNVADTKFGI
jgi:predicted nuclease of restriction endonuclease-like (RecB) superfamily